MALERGDRRTATAGHAPMVALAALAVLFLIGVLTPAREFLADPEDYLIPHLAAEVVTIAIALMVFALSLHLRGENSTRSLTILGAASLSVALLDFAHLLSYPGMPTLVTESNPETAIYFWLAGRGVIAAALLVVAAIPDRRIGNLGRGLLTAGAVAAPAIVYWVVLTRPDSLPPTFVEGQGLTPLKVGMEYGLATACLVAAVLMWRRSSRDRGGVVAWQWLAAAAATMAMSAVFLTLYSSVTDTANLLGHLYQVAAFLMIYHAVFVQAVQRPQSGLERERGLLRAVIDSVPDRISLRDPEGRTMAANDARVAGADTGQRGADGTGDRPVVTHHQEVAADGKGGNRTFDVIEARAVAGGDSIGTVEVRRDVTELIESRRRLAELANSDPVTGLANRSELLRELDERCRGTGSPFALIRVLVQGLSALEASGGPGSRDDAAVAIAERIRGAAGRDAQIARVESSEFAVLLPGAGSAAAGSIGAAVAAALAEPLDQPAGRQLVTARVGIALCPIDADNGPALMSAASAAVAQAVIADSTVAQFFTRGFQQQAADRAHLLADLGDALETDQLRVVYQPQVRLSDRDYLGVEALVRWEHPQRGLLLPDDFIRLAEEGGLIDRVGRWVLHHSLDDAVRWRASGLDPRRVAVNVSARQWESPDFVEEVLEALQERGLPAGILELELTESVTMQDITATRSSLLRLSEAGVGVALDDFGTGQSSLSALAELYPERIKIDRSFISRIPRDPRQRELVNAMVTMANALGCLTLAEGVESEAQARILRQIGCVEGQGYLFGPPQERERVAERMPLLALSAQPPHAPPLGEGWLPGVPAPASRPPPTPRHIRPRGASQAWRAAKYQTAGELLASPELKALFSSFHEATGIPIGISDAEGNWVVALGWRPTSTGSHRSTLEAARACESCDRHMSHNLAAGRFTAHPYSEDLVEASYPIMVGDTRIGTFFVGRSLNEAPDIAGQRSGGHGYDAAAHLDAPRELRIPPAGVDRLTGFLTRLIGLVTTLAESTQSLQEAGAQQSDRSGSAESASASTQASASASAQSSHEPADQARDVHQEEVRDDLTGALNRGALEHLAEAEIRRAQRRGTPLSLAMLAVDHVERVNDERGHAARDAVLSSVAEVVRSSMRDQDLLARVPGDEFLLLLPYTGLASAEAACNRIQWRVAEDERLPWLSIGVVEWNGEDLDRLVARAAEALHRAKQAGRGAVLGVPAPRGEPRSPFDTGTGAGPPRKTGE